MVSGNSTFKDSNRANSFNTFLFFVPPPPSCLWVEVNLSLCCDRGMQTILYFYLWRALRNLMRVIRSSTFLNESLEAVCFSKTVWQLWRMDFWKYNEKPQCKSNRRIWLGSQSAHKLDFSTGRRRDTVCTPVGRWEMDTKKIQQYSIKLLLQHHTWSPEESGC